MKQSRRPKNDRTNVTEGRGQADKAAIARRAYELYLERGAEAGHDVDDWLRAEADLRKRSA